MELLEELVLEPGELSQIGGMVVDAGGGFTVSDEFNHRLLHYDRRGKGLQIAGQKGGATPELHYPLGLERIGERLFVADSWNHRVLIYKEGEVCGCIGPNCGMLELKLPVDVKLGPDGLVWVVDNDAQRVVCFDAEDLSVQKLLVGQADQQDVHGISVRRLGVNLHYPRQLRFAGDYAYLIDSRQLLRLGPREHDESHLALVKPRHEIVAVNPSQAITYEPFSGELMCLCFHRLDISPLVRLPPMAKYVGCIDQHLWLLDEGHLKKLALGVVRFEADNWRPHLNESQAYALHNNLVAQLSEPFRFDGPARSHLQHWLAGSHLFQTTGPVPLIQMATSWAALKTVLSPEGQALLQNTEGCLRELSEAHKNLFVNLQVTLSERHPDASTGWAFAVAERCVQLFAELMAQEDALYDELAELVARPSLDAPRLRQLDGCMFVVQRYIKFGFGSLLNLKKVLLSLGLQKLAHQDLALFFVLEAPDEFKAFLLHALNCLSRRFPQRFACEQSASAALARCWVPLCGSVLADAGLRQNQSAEAVEGLNATRLGCELLLARCQLFLHRGRLHKAFGFPNSLIYVLMFEALVLPPGAQAGLAKTLPNEPLWADGEVRSAVANYHLLMPDRTTGRALLAEEQARNSANHQDSASLLCQQAILTETSLAEALALLDPLEGLVEATQARAQVYANFGEFEQALALCAALDTRPWHMKVLLVQLYLCTGRNEQAEVLFENAIDGMPKHFSPLFRAIVCRQARRYDTALGLFEQLRTLYPPTFDFQLGLLLRMMGRDQQALERFTEQAQRCPFLANTREMLLTLRKMGKMEAYSSLLAELPDAAFLAWDGVRVGVRAEGFAAVVDAYLRWEREELPDLTVVGDAQRRCAEMLRSQLMESIFFMYQDPGEWHLQSECTFAVQGDAYDAAI